MQVFILPEPREFRHINCAFKRIVFILDRTVFQDFVRPVQMRTGCISGLAAFSDGISLIDRLAICDVRFGKMRQHTLALAVLDRNGKAVPICSIIHNFRNAIMRCVDDGPFRDAKIDAIVSGKPEWCVHFRILPEALSHQWLAGNGRKYHENNDILIIMEIQDYMADLFPDEREQISAFLRENKFSDETIDLTFRMMIAGATGLFSLETGIPVPNNSEQSDRETYSQMSKINVQKTLQLLLREKRNEIMNYARRYDMRPTLSEAAEMTLSDLQ